ncbi:MAG: carbohydrate binding family 9 domain-containing protein [Candidatus Eisenbacteria bacterium]|nr:carbohydrate binding family 9 domain-containing protein [Candidatus Eisenbacteria bacterium]
MTRAILTHGLVALAFLCTSSAAEETWHVARTTDPPVLDGSLDDPCWALGTPRIGFIQRDPNPGEPSREQTTLYSVYTDDALYIAYHCGDSQPDRIVSRLRSRDSSVWPDDDIDLWIDPTGNGLQLYYFSTNPAGVKYDALYTSRGRDSNPLWDAHWDVAAAITEDGWNAEFEIPFSNLKFDFDPGRPWLFNAGRVIRRTGEESYSTAIPYEHNMFYVEDAVRLVGLQGIDPGVGVKVTPYCKGDHRWFPSLTEEDDTDLQTSVGADIDVDIGSNLTLAAAIYPDFAEIDLNPDQYQIGFDQVYVPETRPFFLRDSNYFNTINFQPFYSRRIGKRLFDEEGVYHDADIVAGVRLTGKVGKFGLGSFYAHTDEALSEPL